MSELRISKSIEAVVFVALVAIAAGSRFVGAEANFAAVSAAALFAGFFFKNRLVALCVPILAMLASDLVHGFYHPGLMVIVYAMLAMPVLMRSILGVNPGVARIAVSAMFSSVSFLLVTNFGVWAMGDGVAYAKDASGLLACYTAAMPFFRGSLAGDLVYSGVFFGVYALVRSMVSRREVALAPA